MTSKIPGLQSLARLYGVQVSYRDGQGIRRETSPESLLAVLTALGASVHGAPDVQAALRERRLALWQRPVPAATVVWEGTDGVVELRLPERQAGGTVRGDLSLEDGQRLPATWDLSASSPSSVEAVEGERFLLYRLDLPKGLPFGYHRFSLDLPGADDSVLVIVAPRQCAPGPTRDWGVFLPLHALRSAYDWGTGDYVGLAELARWAASLGASTVGTLPLLPTFLGDPFDPSPYSPITRLAWNPLFIDVARAPGAHGSRQLSELLESPELHLEIETLRNMPEVDYRRVMTLKRHALEHLAETPDNNEAIIRFASEHPVMNAFAQFMAARERQGNRPWRHWPEQQRRGDLQAHDYGEDSWRCHLYGQMASVSQLDALKNGEGNPKLYLDFPVGVHPDGFDAWRQQGSFADGVTVGAPPDDFFTGGQDWGFHPLHPERAGDHGYFIAAVRHHMRYASLLRLDHVMGLHRLYWIPDGAGPTDGAYVKYSQEESYAILALESHRHGVGVVGEDLGTVPPTVPRAMARHGLKRMFVLQFKIAPDSRRSLRWPTQGVVASVNTHDTVTFDGYWRGDDITVRQELGLIGDSAVKEALDERSGAKSALVDWLRRQGLLADEDDEAATMRAMYAGLAASPADLVLVNLEDLWLEPNPQNMPGTSDERPNWRRKARYTVEEFTSLASIRDALTEVTRLRRRDANERADSRKRGRSN